MDSSAPGFICTWIHLHLDSSAQWFICTDLWIDLGSEPGTIHWLNEMVGPFLLSAPKNFAMAENNIIPAAFLKNNFISKKFPTIIIFIIMFNKLGNTGIALGIYFRRKIVKFWNKTSKNTIGYSNIYFTNLPKLIFSGVYECQISTSPVRSLQFNLQISGTVPFNTRERGRR